MLDAGTYIRALQQRQQGRAPTPQFKPTLPWNNFQPEDQGFSFNPDVQLDTSRMSDIPPLPTQQVVQGQQFSPELFQLLATLLGQ